MVIPCVIGTALLALPTGFSPNHAHWWGRVKAGGVERDHTLGMQGLQLKEPTAESWKYSDLCLCYKFLNSTLMTINKLSFTFLLTFCVRLTVVVIINKSQQRLLRESLAARIHRWRNRYCNSLSQWQKGAAEAKRPLLFQYKQVKVMALWIITILPFTHGGS